MLVWVLLLGQTIFGCSGLVVLLFQGILWARSPVDRSLPGEILLTDFETRGTKTR